MNTKAFTPLFWRNTNNRLHSAKRAGFTLLELIIVILIIAILATVAVPQYVEFKEKAIAAEAINIMYKMKRELYAYGVLPKDVPGVSTKYWIISAGPVNWTFPPEFGFRAFVIANRIDTMLQMQMDFDYNTGDNETWTGNYPYMPGGPTS